MANKVGQIVPLEVATLGPGRGCRTKTFGFTIVLICSGFGRRCQEAEHLCDIRLVHRQKSPRECYLMAKHGQESTHRFVVTVRESAVGNTYFALADKIRHEVVRGNLTRHQAIQLRDELVAAVHVK